jgi:hypothetical protein
MLTAIETTATIGANGHLVLDEEIPASLSEKVRVIVLFSGEEFSEKEWLGTITHNPVFDFLKGPAEDLYTLEDGIPLTDEE